MLTAWVIVQAVSFNNIGKLRVSGDKVVTYALPFSLDGINSVVLHVVPAIGTLNKPFNVAGTKYVAEHPVPRNAPDEVKLQVTYRMWAYLMAHHVIRGWQYVIDDDGKTVESTVANVEELLLRIAEDAADVFDGLMRFVTTVDNFRVPDAEGIAKN